MLILIIPHVIFRGMSIRERSLKDVKMYQMGLKIELIKRKRRRRNKTHLLNITDSGLRGFVLNVGSLVGSAWLA